MARLTKTQQAERDAAIEQLRAIFPPNTTVPVVLRHVSRSGMMRAISVLTPDAVDVSWLVARATGFKFNDRYDGLTVGECGLDMGFHVVYTLARTLYGTPGAYVCNGHDYGSGETVCHSNDHNNGADYTPGRVHSDGGYALTSRWV